MMIHSLFWHYVFAAVILLSAGYLNWYYFAFCCRASGFAKRYFVPAAVIFAALFSVDSIEFLLGNYESLAGELCSLLGAAWLLAEVLCIVLMAVFGVLVLLSRLPGWPIRNVVRRIFFAAGILLFIFSFCSMYNGWRNTVVVRYDFKAPQLTGGNLRIAYFSDLHMGNVYNLVALNKILRKVNDEKPDVLFIGGDLFDSELLIKPGIKLLDNFSAKTDIPVFFVMGNHEYYCNEPLTERELLESRVRLLQDKTVLLPGRNVAIGGADYPMKNGTSMKFDKNRAESALRLMTARMPKNSVRILLAHSPEFIEIIDGRKMVDLLIAGHTHGGQVQLGKYNLFESKFPYLRGRYDLPNLTAIISTGAGSWLPARLNCPAEINLIEISAR